ncbi:MAG: kelch repeat-containing protein, partial [Armatimonadota bacterium]
VVGGLRSQGETRTFDSIQLIDLKTRHVSVSPGRLHLSRFGHDSAYLPGVSKLVIAGGKHVDTDHHPDGKTFPLYKPTDTIELWDPASGQVTDGGHMTVARDRPKLVPIDDTHLLIVGGTDENSFFDSIELYDASSRTSRVVAHMSVPRMATIALPNGKHGALLMGGWVKDAEAGRAIEYIDFNTFQVSTVGQAVACRAEGSALWTGTGRFILIGGKDAFRGRNPHDYTFKTTESFTVRR